MICMSVGVSSLEKAREMLIKSQESAEILELRVDLLNNMNPYPVLSGLSLNRPILYTVRSKEQGGKADLSYQEFVIMLQKGITLGADLIDVELSLARKIGPDHLKKDFGEKLLISQHYFEHTPKKDHLMADYEEMIRLGARIAKVVTMAQNKEDNLVTLSAVKEMAQRGNQVIGFCMGEAGIMSRILCPVVGGLFTFATPNDSSKTAPGQVPATMVRNYWDLIGFIPKNRL